LAADVSNASSSISCSIRFSVRLTVLSSSLNAAYRARDVRSELALDTQA
jgi:hypothetical protein